MSSMFKIGEIITVRTKYHKGSKYNDYPFSFTSEMLKYYGGKQLKILLVQYSEHDLHCKHHQENFTYLCKTLDGYETSWTWSSAMFVQKNRNWFKKFK